MFTTYSPTAYTHTALASVCAASLYRFVLPTIDVASPPDDASAICACGYSITLLNLEKERERVQRGRGNKEGEEEGEEEGKEEREGERKGEREKECQ